MCTLKFSVLNAISSMKWHGICQARISKQMGGICNLRGGNYIQLCNLVIFSLYRSLCIWTSLLSAVPGAHKQWCCILWRLLVVSLGSLLPEGFNWEIPVGQYVSGNEKAEYLQEHGHVNNCWTDCLVHGTNLSSTNMKCNIKKKKIPTTIESTKYYLHDFEILFRLHSK